MHVIPVEIHVIPKKNPLLWKGIYSDFERKSIESIDFERNSIDFERKSIDLVGPGRGG